MTQSRVTHTSMLIEVGGWTDSWMVSSSRERGTQISCPLAPGRLIIRWAIKVSFKVLREALAAKKTSHH